MSQQSLHTFVVDANLEEVRRVMRLYGVTEVTELFQRMLAFEQHRARFAPRPKKKQLGVVQ
jgi:hypothetical protein